MLPYSGLNYPPVFAFPDRINIPYEFELTYYDDNELLKFGRVIFSSVLNFCLAIVI